MEIIGTLKLKCESQQVSDKFKKREFVVTTDDAYPQHISIQLTQDKCELISPIAVGSQIKVHINLRGREWTSPAGEVKYFNTIEAWRIEVLENLQVDKGSSNTTANEQEDDLPF